MEHPREETEGEAMSDYTVEAKPGEMVMLSLESDEDYTLDLSLVFKTRAELEEFIGKLQIAAMVAWGVYRSDEKRK